MFKNIWDYRGAKEAIQENGHYNIPYKYSGEWIEQCIVNAILDKFKGGNTMRKSDIRDTDIVYRRTDDEGISWEDLYKPEDVDEYTLKDVAYKNYDIVKVVRPEQVLWEEETQTEMTIAELEKKLGIKNLKIVK